MIARREHEARRELVTHLVAAMLGAIAGAAVALLVLGGP